MGKNPSKGGFFLDTSLNLCHYENIMARYTEEEIEQIGVVNYCLDNGYKIHHSANEVGGSTAQLKMRAIKAKRMGTSKGFPDLLIFLPIKGIMNNVEAYQPLAIEMKRKGKSVTSPEQKAWGKVLEMAGIPFKVCKGKEEAIAFIEETAKGIYEDYI